MPGSSIAKTHRTQIYKGLLILFALIPGFRKTPEAPLSNSGPAEASGAEILTVHLRPSRHLWYAQCIVHGVLAISLAFAVIPLIFKQPWWFILWLMGMAGLLISWQICYTAWRALPQVLHIAERGWLLTDAKFQREIVLSDEAVVLPWLMVLPCRDKNNKTRIHLVILPDSTSSEAHRRLRVWLRTRR
ncbi:protein YgfX [Cellvibrio sp. PSBB006]|uniref:protein YgfX n=1 Tax=Cellvibrio sp. PSBB006 TaxID=1987723 RepID=UPI003510EA8A